MAEPTIKVAKNAANVVNKDATTDLARLRYRVVVAEVHLLEELLGVAPDKSVLKKKSGREQGTPASRESDNRS